MASKYLSRSEYVKYDCEEVPEKHFQSEKSIAFKNLNVISILKVEPIRIWDLHCYGTPPMYLIYLNVLKISLVPEKHFQAEKSIWCKEF